MLVKNPPDLGAKKTHGFTMPCGAMAPWRGIAPRASAAPWRCARHGSCSGRRGKHGMMEKKGIWRSQISGNVECLWGSKDIR